MSTSSVQEPERQLLLGHHDRRPQPTVSPQDPLGFTRTTYLALALTFLLEMSNVVLAVPLIALYEQAICRNHYRANGAVGDDLCKAVPVQSELALLRGWQGFFNGFSGMLAALLWTILVCNVHAMPVRLVWMTSLFLLCGGGNYGAEMLLVIILVNSASDHNRTRSLYYMYSIFIFTELVGPQLSKWTLHHSIWLAFSLGLLSLLACFPILAALPRQDSQQDHAPGAETETMSLWEHIRHESYERLLPVRLLFSSRNMCFSVPLFLVGTFRNVSLRALLQYVPVQFDWSLSDANWLITEVAMINLALFFVILPSAIYGANRWLRPHQQTLNLRIVQCSFAVLIAGSAGIGLSKTSNQIILSLGLYAFGFGARVTLLSLVTYWFDKDVRTRLYSAILLLELTGMLVGDTIVQNILSVSFSLPRAWMGITFLFCTVCYFLSFASSFGIRLILKSDDNNNEISGEES
ncbi:MFS multidrug transporter [Fusarium austroafricanum]|uniref:MFS multidrug transporter n=1 Tax=Fusarium austroafricanum TaxID=2364996 RepID=A0A8H4NL29_9HYPO|nr:MFS multidrug transporter [Fusarium austroafricanum]